MQRQATGGNVSNVELNKGDKIYLAGPMSGKEGLNFLAFTQAERYLAERGYSVANPHKFGDKTKSRQCNIAQSLFQIQSCQAVYFLRGWEHSDGAKLEFEAARKMGKILMFEHFFDK